jgi:hypothetical protein
MTKNCSKCGQEKPLEEFSRQSDRRSGYASWCRTCCRERYLANQEARQQKSRDYYYAHRKERKAYMRQRFAQVREQDNERRRQRYAANREAEAESTRRNVEGLRQAVLDHYGQSCACCGITRNLSIDHVNGGSKAHLREIGGRDNFGAADFWRWLVNNGFPEGFQTLCRSCNSSKRDGPACRIEHGSVRQVVAAGGSVACFRR